MSEVESSSDDDYVPSEDGNESVHDPDDNDDSDIDEVTAPEPSTHQSESNEAKADEEIKESEEERKRRLDALFDDFIGGTPSCSEDPAPSHNPVTSQSEASKKESTETEKLQKEDDKTMSEPKTITEIFDFAGEEVRIERTVPEPDAKPDTSTGTTASKTKRSGAGLGDALKLLSKKPKMSVLDKTEHDWTNFKSEHKISDELQSHNRGREGYVERMAFLNRADVRQFERERDARNAARSNK